MRCTPQDSFARRRITDNQDLYEQLSRLGRGKLFDVGAASGYKQLGVGRIEICQPAHQSRLVFPFLENAGSDPVNFQSNAEHSRIPVQEIADGLDPVFLESSCGLWTDRRCIDNRRVVMQSTLNAIPVRRLDFLCFGKRQ